jgi:hypothetical protein
VEISIAEILAILFGLVILSFTGVMFTAILRINKNHSTSLRLLFEHTHFLKLATILVVIISATFLQVDDKLSEGIIGILGGIVGYVLGGMSLTNIPSEPKNKATSSTSNDKNGQN